MENQNLCKIIDLWHDPHKNKFDVPKADYGLEIPCLVCRRRFPSSTETEVIADTFIVKDQVFVNTTDERVLKWCYIDDIKPAPYSKHWMDLYEIKETGCCSSQKEEALDNYHFYYTQIDIKDDFAEVFKDMDKESMDYKCLFKSFDEAYDHPSIRKYFIPTENGNDFFFDKAMILYVIRYGENGRTLLAAKERMLLELAVSRMTRPVFLRVSYGENE